MEDELCKSYGRKRLAQHFDTPPSKRVRTKSHSPNFETVTWDKQQVLEDLQNHPPYPLALTGKNLPENTKHLVKIEVSL